MPDSYARTAFAKSYDRLRGYNWFAAGLSHGVGIPDKHQYVRQCMLTYRAMIGRDDSNIERVHEAVAEVEKFQVAAMAAENRGLIGARNTPEGRRYYPKFERVPTLPSGTDADEVRELPSWRGIDPQAELRRVELRLLIEAIDEWMYARCTPAEYQAWQAMVSEDATTQAELAAVLGYESRGSTHYLLGQVRRHAAEWAEAHDFDLTNL